MIFYDVQGTLLNDTDDYDRPGRISLLNKARDVNALTERFNTKIKEKECYFLSEIEDGQFQAGIISSSPIKNHENLKAFLKALGIEYYDFEVTETVTDDMLGILRSAMRSRFFRESEKPLKKADAECLTEWHLSSNLYDERTIEPKCKSDLLKETSGMFAKDDIVAEIERIFLGRKQENVKGHPVHYLIETDDHETRKNMCRLLISALLKNGRIENQRYGFTDIKPDTRISQPELANLFKMNIGGTLIIRYVSASESDEWDNETDLADGEIEVVCSVCRNIKKYHNDVQIILCLPRESRRLKELFYEHLECISLVEIREEPADVENAKRYLRNLAKADKVPVNRELFSEIEEDREYLSRELQKIYDTWLEKKLKNEVFPQYNAVKSARTSAVKEDKGSAYDELQKMVGLTEAKTVIEDALNFYRAQKLFSDMGMKKSSPSMHMVFTGNPGSAKTTVARLFARILRENRVLSGGQCIEVGRGDLVGRYVGWTAKTVQKAFQRAKGGVLFIDEAYSLVDDRSGSFGDEAINTIVQEMENHRSDVVVIFAGYPDKMEEFLEKNPGLRSRIAFHVPFSDYTPEELCKITELMAKKLDVSIETEAVTKLLGIYENAYKQSDFGNGRFARNVLERARMRQSKRLLEMSLEKIRETDVKTLCSEDFEMPEGMKRKETRVFGFGH